MPTFPGLHRHALLVGSSLLALSLSATVAAAQSAPATADDPNSVEAVVVTGFRASLESAINAKRNDSGVVDVIKAEDIASFPDLNLAESLQRIPGVAITRVAGEGRQISVRGLGPDYTRVRVNGMEALATSGGTDSGGAVGNNRGRGFDFNIFASELFNALTVRKTSSADVEEGSLGATVDLATGRPFDYRKPTLVLSAQAGYNDLSRSKDPRFAALATRTWFDGKLGALVSVAYAERDILEEGHGTTQWAAAGSNGGFSTASTLPGVTPAQLANSGANTAIFHPRNPSYNSYEQKDKRLGVTASLQFKPTDRTLISLNGLYGKLDSTRVEQLLQGISFTLPRTGKPETIIRTGEVDGDRNLQYGVFDNVDLRTQAGYHESSTKFTQLTLDFSHEFTDKLRVSGLVGRAESNFANPIASTVTFDRANVQNYVYDYRDGKDRLPLITFNLDPTQPSSWTSINGTSEVRLRPEWVNNTFVMTKAKVEYDLTGDVTLEAGADRRKFDFDSRQQRRIAGETVTQTLTATELAGLSRLYSGFGRNLDLPAGVVTSWLVPDIQKFASQLGIFSNTGIYKLGTLENTSARGATGSVTEDDRGAYVMGKFRTQVAGFPLRGDLGVRYSETKQTSSGYAAVGTAINLVTAERTYHNTLPSLNLTLEATPDLQIRFGAAKTIARPSLGSLSPGGDVSVQGVNGSNRSFSSGNPDLAATASNNLDLSIEWYPQKGAVYAAGLFQKDIGTFAQTLRTTAPYNTLGLPPELIAGTGALPTDDFEVTKPVNTKGGKLRGLELNVQQPFTFLPGFWSHFGVLANYTYVKSDIQYLTSAAPGAPTVTATLVGLSKNAANGTLYYETDRFSIRGSLAYRSGYLTQVPGRNGNFVEGVNSTLNVDAQASYDLNDHLQISLEALNLTDEFNDKYVDVSDRPWVYMHTGRQYYVGARYTF
ncbi:MAG: TonB-dependent receptor [Caulobacter sp.]|nr:TonB-dependent receptor [Caulobacter sp.]